MVYRFDSDSTPNRRGHLLMLPHRVNQAIQRTPVGLKKSSCKITDSGGVEKWCKKHHLFSGSAIVCG